jgi:YesN/AraC family two-component response regulator
MESLHNPRPALSILIVEDDTVCLGVIGRMIASKFPGITINSAENGKLGVQLFKEHAPDIVITDINMPEMNGIQMTSEIKSIKADVKFIVITGYSDGHYLQIFRETGINDFIVKPIEFGRLFAMIEKSIDEIELQRQ